MFLKIVERLFQSRKKGAPDATVRTDKLERAFALMLKGEKHEAVTAFRAYLETDPYNVSALNDLGACLFDTGDTVAAHSTLELAYSLDDSFIPVVSNHAKILVDEKRSQEALPFLAHAKLSDPNFSHADAVYAGLCLSLGDVAKAQHFQFRAWMGNFDNLRMANGYVFNGAYDDLDESMLAAEHRFWAATAKPVDLPESSDSADRPARANAPGAGVRGSATGRRLRIGYWSPDFRSHSVRYFFRPLLENHDSTEFEVFLYHDVPQEDEQTKFIKAACSNFHDVCSLPDAELFKLVRSHELDFFVELAGHSSHNRIVMLQRRFATVQISGIGYPPTTGLDSIDAKVMDRHIVTPDSARHYTEAPLALPTSFWCFDPAERIPEPGDSPALHNGHVTFGCVGNIAKISQRILACWKIILERLPSSRLLIRSINFVDPAAEAAMLGRLTAAGIAEARVDLRKPTGGVAFFESYNEIDIILDTFPFNGGTTTCFATYMGVPVVSWKGNSLISRMGWSVLSNLGEPELVVEDPQAYVAKALELAGDTGFLQRFRRSARERFQATSLGNGKLFAREFEQGCRQLLDRKLSGAPGHRHAVPALDADELIRRAYAVLRKDQPEASARILNHCLAEYPDNGSAHIMIAHQLSSDNRYQEAVDYLRRRLDDFTPQERVAALIGIVRFQLLCESTDQCTGTVAELARLPVEDAADDLQVKLYQAHCAVRQACATRQPATADAHRHFLMLIPCDDLARFEAMRAQIAACCQHPAGWLVQVERCDEGRRHQAYSAAMHGPGADIIVLVQKNVALHNPMFLHEVAAGLAQADLLGFSGAGRWTRLDWHLDDFACRAAGFMMEASEKAGFVEILWAGCSRARQVADIVVLDGSLLAFAATRLRSLAFDEELLGADLLLEQDWAHAAFEAGLKVAVNRSLGVMIDQNVAFDAKYRGDGRMHLSKKLGLDPLAMKRDDHMMISMPVPNPIVAVATLNNFLEEAA